MPVSAQTSQGYKLVIVIGDGGTAVVDYPTLTRCQKAAAAVEDEWKRRFADAQANQRSENVILTKPAFRSFAFCIPA